MNPTTWSDPLPDAADWFALTASDRKRQAYAQDLHFRESWADVVDLFGAERHAKLGALAMFTFKADGVAGRRLRATMEFFDTHGFRVVGVAPFQHNRQSMRAVWQYDWHMYPVERLLLCSVMHAAAPTLLLLLVDTRYDGVVPGTMRLSELKGSNAVAERQEQHLRTVLAPPHKVINFVHVADEPADLVREIGILFERDVRRILLTQARDHFDDDLADLAEAEIDRLERRCPASDFDIEAAFERLAARGVAGADLDRLRAARGAAEKLSWDELVSVVDPAEPDLVWDFVRIATEVLPMERPGFTGTMPAPTSAEWMMRANQRAVRQPDALVAD
ncbi:nucleoside-diphosphate kinase [Micromonospora sp. FIMYZ51]|uniref:hypothetical protein n=1 Tax=Micromonospora sp. FIMYZ51 TaxID=3051832 RepID=UPI00311FF720